MEETRHSHLSHLSWQSPCTWPASILVIQYFRYCAMSSVSWYFFMSPCMLSLHLFLGRPLFLLPKTSSRSDLHRCGWVLASSSDQTTFVFCFPGKFQQVLRGPPSWCLHIWCDPTWSSLLPISTSSFRLNLICSHLSFLRPNILNRKSSLVWWLFWRLCLSILRASSYRTSPRILPSTSYTRFLSCSWHQPVNLPKSWTVTRGMWRLSLLVVQHQSSLLWFLYYLWGSASTLSLLCWSSAHGSQTQLYMFPGLPPLPHEHTAPGRPRTSLPWVEPSLCFPLERPLL